MAASTSSRVLAMGSACCALCGNWMPQQQQQQQHQQHGNHRHHYTTTWCQRCNTLQSPAHEAYPREACSNTAAALLFTPAEIRAAQVEVQARAAEATTTATVGTTHVDNRVLEEAFCESCGVHRHCKVFARQTRSADEGQTIFYQCTKCRAEWQLNS
ncbi:DNA-directed RNA polymerase [Trypanosoma grayi]|uniref:DNA-directed RNA polymerase n=1 Tax=Trypanosoma grayi TaxID=71804 RepID=UPI0004F481E4|nr:DNA-directed RNA polymerase [Trypanosoma grayi]KEG08986.1 DNA-directed RNA polymerase [Trypanosoma grayi]